MARVSLDTISAALATKHFVAGCLINTAITAAVNFFIDRTMRNSQMENPATVDDALAVVVLPKTAGDILVFVAIVSYMTFLGSGSVIKHVTSGSGAPIKQSVLAQSTFHRVVGFVGNRKVSLFVLYSLIVPGAIVVAVMLAGCALIKEAESDRCLMSSTSDVVLATMVWKAFIAVIVYTLNYIASLNDSQQCFRKVANSEKAE